MMDVVNVLGREPAMYIGGSWVKADEGHAEQALEAARRAQREWSRRSGPERGAVLKAIADEIRTHQEELARLVVAEQGKTITEARGEVGDAAAGFFDYYATFERAQVGSMFAPDEPNEQLFVKSVPYGVVVGIIPW